MKGVLSFAVPLYFFLARWGAFPRIIYVKRWNVGVLFFFFSFPFFLFLVSLRICLILLRTYLLVWWRSPRAIVEGRRFQCPLLTFLKKAFIILSLCCDFFFSCFSVLSPVLLSSLLIFYLFYPSYYWVGVFRISSVSQWRQWGGNGKAIIILFFWIFCCAETCGSKYEGVLFFFPFFPVPCLGGRLLRSRLISHRGVCVEYYNRMQQNRND